MTELFEVQASSYTDASSELSLTELGRVAIKGMDFFVSSDGTVYTEGQSKVGSITAISQILAALGWITYSEPRRDYIQSGQTAVNWQMIPKDTHGDVLSYNIAEMFRYIIEVSYDLGITRAIELHAKRVSIKAVRMAVQNGVDGSLLDSLTE